MEFSKYRDHLSSDGDHIHLNGAIKRDKLRLVSFIFNFYATTALDILSSAPLTLASTSSLPSSSCLSLRYAGSL